MERIEGNDLPRVLREHLSLIVGPAFTCTGDFTPAVIAALEAKCGHAGGHGMLEATDHLLRNGVSDDQLRQCLNDHLKELAPSAFLSFLVKFRYRAVLSVAPDRFFEQALQSEYRKRPKLPLVATITDFESPPPAGTIPVYKLLGDLATDTFSISRGAFSERKARWPLAFRDFADRTQAAPVLCLGMGEFDWVAYDIFAALGASRATRPSAVLFLEDDPILANAPLIRFIERSSRIYSLAVSLSQLAAAFPKGPQLPLTAATRSSGSPYGLLDEFRDVAVVVGNRFESSTKADEKTRLRDLLFSPSVPNWDPYVHDLDFRRTVGAVLADELSLLLEKTSLPAAVLLEGNAATGKTAVAKRIAYDLAKRGHLVVWPTPSLFSDRDRRFRDLMTAIARIAPAHAPVVIVIDDAVAENTISPRVAVGAALDRELRPIVISLARTSDVASRSMGDLLGGLPCEIRKQVPDDFDEKELDRLPEYLVRLGVAEDIAAANASVSAITSKHARDTLCALYYLLPDTRQAIAGAIREEYFRLGDPAGLTKVIVGAFETDSVTIREAYQFVAVADYFGVPVPTEVLVSALNITWGDWVDATPDGARLWGLLYPDEDPLNEDLGICYRTRNDVVTQTIVRAINGGTLKHPATLATVLRLAKACSGSSTVYREFLVRLLVNNKRIEATFGFDEGCRLFEAAISALPFPDRTLKHHFAKWHRIQGRDPVAAERMLQDALATPPPPQGGRGEKDANLYTSLAATKLSQMRKGVVPRDVGQAQTLEYLEKAQALHGFNPNASHVYANLLAELATEVGDLEAPDTMNLIGRALAELDRARAIVAGAHGSSRVRYAHDCEVLEQLRLRLLGMTGEIGSLQKAAEDAWTHTQRQDGFVLAGRRLLCMARTKDRGTNYKIAFKYVEGAMQMVTLAGATIVSELLEVAAMLYYEWRIHRAVGSDTLIEWAQLRAWLAPVLKAKRDARGILERYIDALAAAHMNEWAGSSAVLDSQRQFDLSRDFLRGHRDFLLDSKGRARLVQGLLRKNGERRTFYCEELGFDFRMATNFNPPVGDAIIFAQISFSLDGFRAVGPAHQG